ncbi:MAG: hypothetical protein GF317_06805 [Candidatus Lokiarchaeota archaeon]|nr:hypothetical protein [Candidatus Lokiarchaeota archaeon]MBD3199419.1 hypothetical protein [Candidatus Lokiarchaeota archaeon]
MIEYIIIAILQGLFEWLPISSSGQVFIVATNIFGISAQEAYSLAIWLHLGTTLAVLVKFHKEYIIVLKSLLPQKFILDDKDIKLRNWIIIATLGTAITGIPLYIFFKFIVISDFTAIQGDVITLLVCGLLIITGIILLARKNIYGEKTIEVLSDDLFQSDSFLTGLAQGVSILPGISRSGITVSAILLENYEQDHALRLSFLISVPVAFASIGVDIIFGSGSVLGILNPLVIIVTTLISFLIGFLTMEILLRFAKKIEFGYFCVFYGIIAYIIIIPAFFIP